ELNPRQLAIFEQIGEELRANGFEAELMGAREVAIQAAPAGIASSDAEKLLCEILDGIARENQAISIDSLQSKIAASTSCHAAIKINTPLDTPKMEWLLGELAKTEYPMSCPHGRPVVLRYSVHEIQRAFKRIYFATLGSIAHMNRLIIAIDGPVGSGKSTLARRVAELLGYVYIDTGAMYRALALKALRRGLSLDATDQLVALARETRIDLRAQDGTQRVFLDGEDVTAAIRTPEVSQVASKVAVVPGVRKVLVAEQRRAGEQGGGVMEGRDIGGVVFPDAGLKIFLTASPEVRAERRWREHQQKDEAIDLARTL